MPKASEMLGEQPNTATEVLSKKDKKKEEKYTDVGGDENEKKRYSEYAEDRVSRGMTPLSFEYWYKTMKKY